MSARTPRAFAVFIGVGLLAGFLSGLFGVGGGTVIVPMLVLLAAFGQKLAAGTSSAAIIPIASVGVISYAVQGNVDWLAALLLAVGAVVGAQVGARLLNRLPEALLRWIFVGFLAVVIVSLFVVVPSREASLEISFWPGAALVATGLIAGVLASLVGVGGGIIVVPALILMFGASDLVAKGTSLMMIIPASLSGTITNIRNRNVDLVGGITLGVAACAVTPLGALVALMVDPRVANILFVVFLLVVGAQMLIKAVRATRRR